MDISNRDDVIDSRDVISRIEELQDEKESQLDALQEIHDSIEEDIDSLKDQISDEEDEQKKEELKNALEGLESQLEEAAQDIKHYEFDDEDERAELLALQEEAESYASDWRHGEALIRETYWKDYVQKLLADTGELPKDLPSYIEIDWDATAENIKVDYTEVDYGGVTYLIRCS